ASMSATSVTQSRTQLRLRPRHCRMPIPPPKNERHEQQDESGHADPSRNLMRHRQRRIKLVTHQVADGHDQRAPHNRAEYVPSEELKERHPARTSYRPCHESHAGNESRHEHRLAAVSLKEKLQPFVARAHERESRGQPREHALSAGAPDNVAAAVAGDRADDYDDIHESQIEQYLPGQESSG